MIQAKNDALPHYLHKAIQSYKLSEYLPILTGWSFQSIIPYSPMRWSLILSTFIVVESALSFVCLALAIPQPLEELERRTPAPAKADPAKLKSKEYRKNAAGAPYRYTKSNSGITREKLKKEDRLAYGKNRLQVPHTDAGTSFQETTAAVVTDLVCRSCL